MKRCTYRKIGGATDECKKWIKDWIFRLTDGWTQKWIGGLMMDSLLFGKEIPQRQRGRLCKDLSTYHRENKKGETSFHGLYVGAVATAGKEQTVSPETHPTQLSLCSDKHCTCNLRHSRADSIRTCRIHFLNSFFPATVRLMAKQNHWTQKRNLLLPQ